MVLRLALYLVERGFYKRVEMAFLVVRLTKNPCDCCFNMLKQDFRQSQVYNMEQLLKVLDANENVTALPFEDHRDWDSFLYSLYVGMPAGAVKKNHNFMVEVDKPTTTSMTIQRTVLEGDQQYTKTYEMANRQLSIVERMALIKEIPHLLEKPGIKKIKQVELVSKNGVVTFQMSTRRAFSQMVYLTRM
jgi:hypothetical protein